MRSVYLAGPDVFYPDAFEIAATKKSICSAHGLVGNFPLDNKVPENLTEQHAIARWIAAENERLIRECDYVIANLTPFRGPGLDEGTAYEIGFARALDKPIFGYSNDPRTFRDRIETWYGEPALPRREAMNILEGPDHFMVEDFALTDNLMIDCGIGFSGGRIAVPTGLRLPNNDLSIFEKCVKLVAEQKP